MVFEPQRRSDTSLWLSTDVRNQPQWYLTLLFTQWLFEKQATQAGLEPWSPAVLSAGRTAAPPPNILERVRFLIL